MIGLFQTITTGPEPDAVWFADRGRRQYRWRPALPGEDGDSVIVHRDGRALSISVAPHDGLRAADDFTLGAMFDAFAQKMAASSMADGQ